MRTKRIKPYTQGMGQARYDLAPERHLRTRYGETERTVELVHDLYSGTWEIWELNCYNSQDVGLGTCRCQSHDPYKVSIISGKDARALLSGK